jgi:hypothetical protein
LRAAWSRRRFFVLAVFWPDGSWRYEGIEAAAGSIIRRCVIVEVHRDMPTMMQGLSRLFPQDRFLWSAYVLTVAVCLTGSGLLALGRQTTPNVLWVLRFNLDLSAAKKLILGLNSHPAECAS